MTYSGVVPSAPGSEFAELPPPYVATPGGVPVVNCKVCQAMINIEGKQQQHVVKCNVCNEATVCRIIIMSALPVTV